MSYCSRGNTSPARPLRELRSNFQNQRLGSIRVSARVRQMDVFVPHKADSSRN